VTSLPADRPETVSTAQPDQAAPVRPRGRRAAGPADDAALAGDHRPRGRRVAAPAHEAATGDAAGQAGAGERAPSAAGAAATRAAGAGASGTAAPGTATPVADAPSGAAPAAPPVHPTRRALRADGRASGRTPGRGVSAARTPGHALGALEAPANRAERRRRRPPRRSAARVAQGAVAVSLALGVGAFVLAPGAVERTTATDAAGREDVDADAAPQAPRIAPEVVEARQSAVVLASSTARQADAVRAGALAAAVPPDAVAELSTAVAELDVLIATTKSAQPAVAALAPPVPPAPVLSGDALAAAVADAGAAAQADAAADAGATATSGDVAPAPSAAAPSAAAPSAAPTTAAPTTAAPAEPAAGDPAAARIAAQVERVATLTAELQVVTEQTQQAAVAAAAAAEEARKEAQRTSLDAYDNGEIPASALCELDFAPGQQLRCDAAEALERLNGAFAGAFGTDLVITDSYRSYSQQVACRRTKGSLCAAPGTSNHGTGTAIDLGGKAYSFGTAQHDWMLAHAEEYGWVLPAWARATGSKPEPWHWEYVG
jgi:LAS superfamily LD-carboxypeptidase LdcB